VVNCFGFTLLYLYCTFECHLPNTPKPFEMNRRWILLSVDNASLGYGKCEGVAGACGWKLTARWRCSRSAWSRCASNSVFVWLPVRLWSSDPDVYKPCSTGSGRTKIDKSEAPKVMLIVKRFCLFSHHQLTPKRHEDAVQQGR
jgi:hypothetical protein